LPARKGLREEARRLAERAVALDPRCTDALTVLAN